MSPDLDRQESKQNIWLNYLSQDLLTSGQLKQLIEQDLITGIGADPTSSKPIMPLSKANNQTARASSHKSNNSVEALYNKLMLDDIRQAATLFLPKYEASGGRDGFVNLSLSPYLANNTTAIVAEAQRFWQAIDHPNIMINVPANGGLPAIHQLIRQGINVNATAIFGLYRYREVIEAYLTALEFRASQNLPLHHLTSVATFYLNSIDDKIDGVIQPWLEGNTSKATIARMLHGQVATAIAKMAFQIYCKIFSGWRFNDLAAKGALPQQLVWVNMDENNSSDPHYDSLIKPETIITMTRKQLEPFNSRREPIIKPANNSEPASKILHQILQIGIDPEQISQQLEKESVQNRIKVYDNSISLLRNRNGH